jgi:hypothetical protein
MRPKNTLAFGKVLDPAEAVDNHYRHKALENLIAFKAQEYYPGRGFERHGDNR